MKKFAIAMLLIALPMSAQAQGLYNYGAPYGSDAARQNELLEQQQRIIRQQEQMQRQMQMQQDMQQGYQDGSGGQFATCSMGGSIDYQRACQRAQTNNIMNGSRQSYGGLGLPRMNR